MKLAKILAPTDFSKFSGFALEWAAYLAVCMKAELILLHVIPEEEGRIVEEIIGEGAIVRIPKGVRQNVVDERQKMFKEQFNMAVSGEVQKSLKVEEILKIGNPFLEILKIAKEKEVDLIVMGTHGRTGLAHVFIGSVAEKVVHHAHCPVLTIKHPQYKFIAP
ncbi:MAG: universal stress protein [Deltaproteobacteria bacterium]|nr:universal stress protein [Deltaproteobacteria bacterium]